MPNRIHPNGTSSSSPRNESSISLHTNTRSNNNGRQVFTVWMKSLIMNCKGCTVFDSDGRIVYRVDNYDGKCNKDVSLMGYDGEVLITILRKKCRMLRRWEGYRSCSSIDIDKEMPFFSVRKPFLQFTRSTSYKVTVSVDDNNSVDYIIQNQSTSKSTCKIIKKPGDHLLAEVRRKQSSSGVLLGQDVLLLMVEPGVDNLLVVGLVVVYGLFNNWL